MACSRFVVLIWISLCLSVVPAAARDEIRIVGSATIYPFSSVVAEVYARASKAKIPVVEITGTVAGITAFCAGVGDGFPDILNASRPMRPEEIVSCARNGVTGIARIVIGYDGITLVARRTAPYQGLTRVQIWRALTAKIPSRGHLVDNVAKSWQDVDPSLPDLPIEVLGPSPTSGTREMFIDLAMRNACQEASEVTALAVAADRQAACGALREDGRYIEAGEYYHLIIQRLSASSDGLIGVLPFGYLRRDAGQVRALPIDGVEPSVASIGAGTYPLARPLFLYVKLAHVAKIPGIRDFLKEYVSERSIGSTGYATAIGLVPLSEAERKAQAKAAFALTPIQ